ncbi:MAG: thiamine-phosphate pyrophosphorylase [Elusimicrobia bacterium CG_4_10_14_3_um_filter_49_12_50_7]|nr:MAG: thiamine-phosphate pyrophosphorylase [Elusimicrobia bacterium CG03_land_8_20_14_0_80_50_18]PIY17511.1 MAG: thiamine-phosphate pyrophosphorylase [Elusimicrobia bacterium CG_4_10_14_3_um_filter_49_12_50_7]
MRKLSIIDANLNRAREGLRVVEDIERFYFKSGKFAELKKLRHRLAAIFADDYDKLVESRDVRRDKGAMTREKGRSGVTSALRANISRAGEALRVLEEISKLDDVKKSGRIKRIRFRLYEIEKDFVKAL